jgi:L-asparaginase II
VLPKVGAEGVHSIALLDRGVGVAVKVEDGSVRAQYPAVLRVLQLLDALPDPLPPRLADFLVKPVRNTRGEVVGELAPAA